ncbi:MAG: hypothetical protein K0R15_616 [Clostridiales bacterium]|jgi:hypothetical protein|nr:hypothetical protein [Clostridiales bacterium]
MIVIYDSEGKIFFQATGDVQVPVGELKTIEFEIPIGQQFNGVDLTSNTPLFAPIPKTEIEILREQMIANEEMVTVALEAIASISEGGV